jgi:hypothetical protein
MNGTQGTRWAIGLVVTAILGFLSLASLYQATLDHVAGTRDDRDESRFRTYTARTTGTVDTVTQSPPKTTATVEFTAVDGKQTITGILWPDGYFPPTPGETVEVAYDPDDPRSAAHGQEVLSLAQEAGGLDKIENVTPARGGGFVPGLVTGFLALVALVGTIVWAMRAPKPQPRLTSPHVRHPPQAQPQPPVRVVGPPPAGPPPSSSPPAGQPPGSWRLPG